MNLKFFTSNNPLSVIFISGITGNAKNDNVKNGLKVIFGATKDTALLSFDKFSITSSDFLEVINPAISRVIWDNTFLSFTTIMPPFKFLSSFAANTISSSLVPQTIKLWESWVIVVAIAPDFKASPFNIPRPILLVPLCLSITEIFKRSLSSFKLVNSFLIFSSLILTFKWILSSLFGISSITFNTFLSLISILYI